MIIAKQISNFFIKVALNTTLTLVGGCLVIRGTGEEWRESEKPVEVSGPGTETTTVKFSAWSRDKYWIDDGTRLGIGFFPGFLYFDKKVRDAGGSTIGSIFGYPFAVAFSHCLIGLPTIHSLFIAPYDKDVRKDSLAFCGIIGCCEWEVGGKKEELIKQGPREHIVRLQSLEVQCILQSEPCGKTANGVPLYFEYPGNATLMSVVERSNSVAVMFEKPLGKMRIFTRSKNVKDAFAYADVNVNADSVECRQRDYWLTGVSLGKRIENLYRNPFYTSLTDNAQTKIKDWDGKLANMMKSVSSEGHKPFVELENGVASMEGELECMARAAKDAEMAALRAMEERRRANELAARQRNAAEKGWRNEVVLKEFAIQEMPALWRTVEELRTEILTRRASLAKLKEEMSVFGIKAEEDSDYIRLSSGIDKLLDSLSSIFAKLETAYIAAQKFNAMPGRKDYQEIMEKAVVDGINEAEAAARLYQKMSKQKQGENNE